MRQVSELHVMRPRAGIAAVVTLVAVACLMPALAQTPPVPGRQLPPVPGRQTPSNMPAPPGPIRFTDITAAAGLRFKHASGGSGHGYFVEQMGGGASFLDYDGDGHLDVFLAGGGTLPGYSGPAPAGNRLLRGRGNGTFVDVTRAAGLVTSKYTLGVASADYDNDGRPDLYITTLLGNALYHNEGNGAFADVTAKAGVSAPAMSTGAAFLDYDNDGRLDLFVSRYLDYSVASDKGCRVSSDVEAEGRQLSRPGSMPGMAISCQPELYEPATNRLFRNRGDGTFADVTVSAGIAQAKARGLGIAVADFNEDGWPDIFVASDLSPNLLFINSGDGKFRNAARKAGIDVYAGGKALSGMGVDVADYDNDGHADLFITNFEAEPSTLYRGRGDGTFIDATITSNVMNLGRPYVKWGCRMLDFNGDGLSDLFVVNGHVDPRGGKRPVFSTGPAWPGMGFAQEAQVFLNQNGERFIDVSQGAGPFFNEKHAARGAAFGDVDNDGDWDVLIVSVNEMPVLLRNDSPPARWARLSLQGDRCNRDGIGARVRVTSGGRRQTEYVKSAGSYLSDHDRRPLIGIGPAGQATAEIRWPCGAVQKVSLAARSTTTVVESGCLRTARPQKTQDR